MRRFVWTRRAGKTVHVSTETQPSRTYCGRRVVADTDAADVLWHILCRRCRAAAVNSLQVEERLATWVQP